MRNGICLIICCLLLSGLYANVTNVSRIAELDQPPGWSAYPRISSDELNIYYMHIIGASPSQDFIYQASRTLKTNPFDAPTSSPFVNIMSSTSNESSPWVSSDGLRIYFASDRDGSYDIWFASRPNTLVPFGAPTKMVYINSISGIEGIPVLANNELSIYFISNMMDIYGPSRIYRATRSSISSDFSSLALVDEIDTSLYLFDVSNDEKQMLLTQYSGTYLFHATRENTSTPFGTPLMCYFDNNQIMGASLNSDWTKIYFSILDSYPTLYQADFSPAAPTPTPPPTPTPILPQPVPDIALVATKDQISNFTHDYANPWAGDFDAQGRYYFFDQKISTCYSCPTSGTNQLIRIEAEGDNPIFSVVATQADLGSKDSAWNGTYGEYPTIGNMRILSDDSIILVGSHFMTPRPLLRIVPGTPPQVSIIALINYALSTFPMGMAVDKSATPNIIYFSIYNGIYRVNADQINYPINSTWTTVPSNYIYGIVVEEGGDLIAAGAGLGVFEIYRINHITGAVSVVASNLQFDLYGNYYSTPALTANPLTGDIFGLYNSSPSYPRTNSKMNIFKMEKGSGIAYQYPDNYVTGYQVLTDPDIAPFCSYPLHQLYIYAGGFSINPSGHWLYISNGWTFNPSAYTGVGSGNIFKIRTQNILNARQSWASYE